MIAQLTRPEVYDLAIVGGGATGLGVALDATLRGLKVVLVESHDFAKGTSSRSTKLLHGGVRYLAQGKLSLVREALHERTTVLHNAPHLAQPLAFVMPFYRSWQTPFYGLGLKMYDLLAGKAGLGKTRLLNPEATSRLLPNVQTSGLKGGVKYWDAQFDDARLAMALARTATAHGALLVNYCKATGLLHDNGKLAGLTCEDAETGLQFSVRARCVINATGVWVDALRIQDGEVLSRPVKAMVAPSQGVHLVVDREFMPGDQALIVPGTADGRVLFAVPWMGKLILGTTDTPREDLQREPRAFEQEIRFILDEAGRYLARRPQRSDVLSIWVGLRPLVRPLENSDSKAGPAETKRLSREHTILVSQSGLVTVTGGKWTTYRAMAEDVLQQCQDRGLIRPCASASTAHQALQGASRQDAAASAARVTPISAAPGPHLYGDDAALLASLPGADHMIAQGLSEAMVRFAVRFECARTVEDVLARRSRLLFLDARAAILAASAVAGIMQSEGIAEPGRASFVELAQAYLLER